MSPHYDWINYLRSRVLGAARPGASSKVDGRSPEEQYRRRGWQYPTAAGSAITAPFEPVEAPAPVPLPEPHPIPTLPPPPPGGCSLDSLEGLLSLTGFGPSPLSRFLGVSLSPLTKSTAWIRKLPAPMGSVITIDEKPVGVALSGPWTVSVMVPAPGLESVMGLPGLKVVDESLRSEDLGRAALASWAWGKIRAQGLLLPDRGVQDEARTARAFTQLLLVVL